ncbi:unnamed protein product, partial [Polarella glacialis]
FWHIKYKHALGGYKKFVQRSSDTLKLKHNKDCSYFVFRAGSRKPEMVANANKDGCSWQGALYKAWRIYTRDTPPQRQDLRGFMRPLGSVPSERTPDDRSAVECYYCKQTGHYKSECPDRDIHAGRHLTFDPDEEEEVWQKEEDIFAATELLEAAQSFASAVPRAAKKVKRKLKGKVR